MKSSEADIPSIIGTAMAGGFYAGRILVDDVPYALIVAPKDDGETKSMWNDSNKSVDGATSFFDGVANTAAMADSGCNLAKWVRDLRIAGHNDWYIPSQDELEIIYRNLKPSPDANSLYARSGINLSAMPPARPYTRDVPAQTQAEYFKDGGEQAFDSTWYWTSTQHASSSNYAWVQDFYGGGQGNTSKDYGFRARAVRRLPI